MRSRASALAGLLLSVFPAVALVASTHVWSGLGANPNWNNGFNWSSDPNSPAAIPSNDPNGVFLQFPATGVSQHSMFQNIPGLTVNNMTFNGGIPYVLVGTPLAVDGAITVGNDPNNPPPPGLFHTIDVPLILLNTLADDVFPGASLRLQGPIIGPGGVTVIGGGTTVLAGDNNYAGPTLVNAGTLVVTSPNALGSGLADTHVGNGGTLRLSNYNQVLDPNNPDPNAVETIFPAAGSRLSAEGTNTVFGIFTGPAGPIVFDLAPGSVLNVDSLGGDGQVFVDFGGTLRITGPSPATGFLGVGIASLIVNGSLVNTSLVHLSFPQALLGGTGVVGSVQVLAGTVSPGESAGVLTVSGNLGYVGAPAAFQVELNGLTAGTGYDQLNATGTVNLGPATSLVATRSFLPPIGSTFTILNAPGGVTGQFVGLPDLTLFPIDGQTYQIDYTATSVILTAMDTMPVTLQSFTLE